MPEVAVWWHVGARGASAAYWSEQQKGFGGKIFIFYWSTIPTVVQLYYSPLSKPISPPKGKWDASNYQLCSYHVDLLSMLHYLAALCLQLQHNQPVWIQVTFSLIRIPLSLHNHYDHKTFLGGCNHEKAGWVNTPIRPLLFVSKSSWVQLIIQKA